MSVFTRLLQENAEEKYKNFSEKLIPDTSYPILGVRVPIIKKIVKNNLKNELEIKEFLSTKHVFYEEWFLHGLLINYVSNDIKNLLSNVENFLPNVDNWAICDSFVSSLKKIKKHSQIFHKKIPEWIKSKHDYTVRFGIVALLDYYLDENFNEKIFDLLKDVKSKNYYVNMALAWFYSVALVKQYDKAVKIIESKTLPLFVHNKSIQKAVESFRISNDKKIYLKSLKME